MCKPSVLVVCLTQVQPQCVVLILQYNTSETFLNRHVVVIQLGKIVTDLRLKSSYF